jgi:aminoglycoside 6'-N-acetyltransferase I
MVAMARVFIRQGAERDAEDLGVMCALLWPDGSAVEHRKEVDAKIRSGRSGSLPLILFVAEQAQCEAAGALCGFIEVGLRSHADGCDTEHPVGYIEGWFVVESLRSRGIGRALMAAAENWSREQGCAEMASDALIENVPSQKAHSELGFKVVDRCVHYRKLL